MNPLLREVQDLVNMVFQRYPDAVRLLGSRRHALLEPRLLPGDRRRRSRAPVRGASAALAELLDERPEIAELLRGRTLARTFH